MISFMVIGWCDDNDEMVKVGALERGHRRPLRNMQGDQTSCQRMWKMQKLCKTTNYTFSLHLENSFCWGWHDFSVYTYRCSSALCWLGSLLGMLVNQPANEVGAVLYSMHCTVLRTPCALKRAVCALSMCTVQSLQPWCTDWLVKRSLGVGASIITVAHYTQLQIKWFRFQNHLKLAHWKMVKMDWLAASKLADWKRAEYKVKIGRLKMGRVYNGYSLEGLMTR